MASQNIGWHQIIVDVRDLEKLFCKILNTVHSFVSAVFFFQWHVKATPESGNSTAHQGQLQNT